MCLFLNALVTACDFTAALCTRRGGGALDTKQTVKREKREIRAIYLQLILGVVVQALLDLGG